MTVGQLQDFVAGKADLTPEALSTLARVLFRADHDPDWDVLVLKKAAPPAYV